MNSIPMTRTAVLADFSLLVGGGRGLPEERTLMTCSEYVEFFDVLKKIIFRDVHVNTQTCTYTHNKNVCKQWLDWFMVPFFRTMVWWFWRMLLCITTKNHVSFRLIVTDIYKTEFQYRLNSWDCKYDYDFNIIFWVINITPYIYCNECIGDAALIGSTCTRKHLSWKESKLQWY